MIGALDNGSSHGRKWAKLEVETKENSTGSSIIVLNNNNNNGRQKESHRLLEKGYEDDDTEMEEMDGGGGHGSTDGSVWGSVFNLCNSAIGAGILALPYAIQQTGVVLGMICMIVMCLILGYTNKILVWTNRLHPGAKSYERLVKDVFGNKASILVTLSVILTTFGACTGFLVIIGDILPPLVQLVIKSPDWLSHRIAVTLAVSIVGILPLASLKNFNSLRFSSTLAIISVSFTVFVILFRSIQTFPLSEEHKDKISLFKYGMGIFDALPLISFAFGCHMQMIPIYAELKDNRYLQFPDSEQGNVLKNYGDKDILVNVARGLLCFVIVCHYPPSNYCCRAALDYLFAGSSKMTTTRRLVWTVIIWGLAFGVAILIPKIDVVFGLIGATANSLIVFIFPALFLINCNTIFDWEGVKGYPAYLVGVTILVIGVVISSNLLICTVMIVIDNWFPNALH